jgi:hypothetical protein
MKGKCDCNSDEDKNCSNSLLNSSCQSAATTTPIICSGRRGRGRQKEGTGLDVWRDEDDASAVNAINDRVKRNSVRIILNYIKPSLFMHCREHEVR